MPAATLLASVVRDGTLTAADKVIFAALQTLADEGGQVLATNGEVSEATGGTVAPATIPRCVGRLAAAGWIRVDYANPYESGNGPRRFIWLGQNPPSIRFEPPPDFPSGPGPGGRGAA